MSKIYVVGGSGRVATHLIRDLVKDGHEVTASSRHPKKIVRSKKVQAKKLDLHEQINDIADQIKGSDIIYFTAGSRGHDLIQTDAMGAIKTMIAAQRVGIKRYIMLSSKLSLDPDHWSQAPGLADYLAAKFLADHYLIDSTLLDYTILQPTNLVAKRGTGKIALDNTSSKSNSISDVARVLADIIKYPNTEGQVIQMTAGKTPIDQALQSIQG